MEIFKDFLMGLKAIFIFIVAIMIALLVVSGMERLFLVFPLLKIIFFWALGLIVAFFFVVMLGSVNRF